MAKGKMAVPRLPLGARAATYRPGFKANSKAHESWKWEFYIRPDTDEANGKVTAVLSHYGDVRTFERCMALPGYAEKQFIYAVTKQMMDFVDRNTSIKGQYKAWVRYHEGGKLYRHRTEEQIAAAKNRKAKKDQKRARMTVVRAP